MPLPSLEDYTDQGGGTKKKTTGGTSNNSSSGGTSTKKSTKKARGIDFNDAAEIYRRLGIPVNNAFINKWKGKVNSLYEFRDMMRWHDASYRKSFEYKKRAREVRATLAAFYPGRSVGMGKLIDTAVRKGWDQTDIYYKLKGTKRFQNKYAGLNKMMAQEPGMIANPVKAAMEYQKYAKVQADIYKSLGLGATSPQLRKAYFSNAVTREEAAQLADPLTLRRLAGANAFMGNVSAGTAEKDKYENLRRALQTQKSYLSSQQGSFQTMRDQTGQLINPYL